MYYSGGVTERGKKSHSGRLGRCNLGFELLFDSSVGCFINSRRRALQVSECPAADPGQLCSLSRFLELLWPAAELSEMFV